MNGINFLENLFRGNFFFRELFYEPLLNGLIWLYETIARGDLGLAIILLTILVRLLIYPLFHQGIKYQRVIQALRPELDKIKTNNSLQVFHAGTTITDNQVVTNGGRVFCVTGRDKDLALAREKVYSAIKQIGFEGAFYRKDIAMPKGKR